MWFIRKLIYWSFTQAAFQKKKVAMGVLIFSSLKLWVTEMPAASSRAVPGGTCQAVMTEAAHCHWWDVSQVMMMLEQPWVVTEGLSRSVRTLLVAASEGSCGSLCALQDGTADIHQPWRCPDSVPKPFAKTASSNQLHSLLSAGSRCSYRKTYGKINMLCNGL